MMRARALLLILVAGCASTQPTPAPAHRALAEPPEEKCEGIRGGSVCIGWDGKKYVLGPDGKFAPAKPGWNPTRTGGVYLEE
jgi:hypothetical protein